MVEGSKNQRGPITPGGGQSLANREDYEYNGLKTIEGLY
jgi:hypothetical protein